MFILTSCDDTELSLWAVSKDVEKLKVKAAEQIRKDTTLVWTTDRDTGNLLGHILLENGNFVETWKRSFYISGIEEIF